VILLRPTIVTGGRLLYQVVVVEDGRERVISPPLSRSNAAKVASWAASSRWATSPKAGV
jgi:hypothetical protein